MAHGSSFDELMARVRMGDNDAIAKVMERYASVCSPWPAAACPTGTFAARSVPKTFFNPSIAASFWGAAHGEFELENWEGLWGLLMIITLRKCGKQVKYFRARRRDVQQEAISPVSSSDSNPGLDFMAHDPSPSEVTGLVETVEQLWRGSTNATGRSWNCGCKGIRSRRSARRSSGPSGRFTACWNGSANGSNGCRSGIRLECLCRFALGWQPAVGCVESSTTHQDLAGVRCIVEDSTHPTAGCAQG